MRQKAILFVLFLLSTLTASAYDANIGGIYYNLYKKEAIVTYVVDDFNRYQKVYNGSIRIPESVTYNGQQYRVTQISPRAFSDNSGLTSVTIPQSVKEIGQYAFYNCTSLKSIIIPDSVRYIGWGTFCGCASLTSVVMPDSLISISISAFEGCTSLTSVIIPSAVKEISYYGFSGCFSLREIIIPDNVTAIAGSAFDGTAWYENQPEGMVYAGKVAYKYKGSIPAVTSFVIEDGTKGIASGLFSGWSNLASVTIPQSVTFIGNDAFNNCTNLVKVIINSNHILSLGYNISKHFGEQVSEYIIGNDVSTIGEKAFGNNTVLKSVTIGSGVTSIGSSSFSGCTGLSSIIIPNSVIEIGEGAFSGCSGLTSITIPNSVTSIGDNAFANCKGLTSITLGSGVKTIGNTAFSSYTELADVYCYAEQVPTVSRNAFQDSYINYVTLHVPAASIEAYKVAATWRDFGEIVALEDEPGIEKCATPVISIVDGRLNISCETEDVEYICRSEFKTDGNNVMQPQKLQITVTATKEGYIPSDTVTEEIDLSAISAKKGDVNTDGIVNGTDIQEVINIIVDGE